jgi:carbon monoxide dehydrogenase subunit G
MKIIGSNLIEYPVEMVWDSLLDPRVLVATIPGCERLVPTGENAYDMTVTAGVAAIKGTYQGSCSLSDLKEHESLVMRLTGAGVTRIHYDADAVVGGMVGGVGQRMLTSVSKRMAGEFFDNVADAIGHGGPGPVGQVPQLSVVAESTPSVGAQVFTAPARAASSRDDFLKGVAVGAGLVVLGVVVGRLFGRP